MRKRYSEALEEFQTICRDVFGEKQVELVDNFIRSYTNYRNNFIFSKRRIDVINDYAKAYLMINVSVDDTNGQSIHERLRSTERALFTASEREQANITVKIGSLELLSKIKNS